MSRKKEIFNPINKGRVGIYTCGPTVYWYAHVGNFRSYVFSDILKRVLIYNEFKINHIINVTDVGHLTSDADTGEDKLEKAAEETGKSAKEISEFYFNSFRKDFRKLNLIEPEHWPKATGHITEQINLIKILEEKGYVYITDDGVYFDTSKFKDYGKLSRKKINKLQAGKRIDLRDKKNITDFALWKFSKPSDNRQQEWKSPWGTGFPGWHIECSAMSSKYLGKHFDIHTGGEDHIPVHHENEIAQSECAFGKSPWVNYWMHGAFLNLKGGKMSKSTGAIKTISQLEEDNVSAMAYKYFTYTAHYRKPLTWSKDAIMSAVNSYKKLKIAIYNIENTAGKNKKYLEEFEDRINDDLDMPGALAVLWRLVRDNKATGKIGIIRKMDMIFGLDLLKEEEIKQAPKAIIEIVKERAKTRKEKNWVKSDELRDLVKEKGWIIKDSKDGFELEKC